MQRFYFETLRGLQLSLTHPAVAVAADLSGDWSWDDRVLCLPRSCHAAADSCVSRWHQRNAVNGAAQRYSVGVVFLVRLVYPTAQLPRKPLRFRCSAVLVWEHPDAVRRLAECSWYRLLETTTAAASTRFEITWRFGKFSPYLAKNTLHLSPLIIIIIIR